MKFFPHARCGAPLALLVVTPAHADELRRLLEATLGHPGITAAEHSRDAATAQRDAATAQRDAATAQRDAATAQRDAAAAQLLGRLALTAGTHTYEGQRVVGSFVPGQSTPPLLASTINQAGASYSVPSDLSGAIAR